MIYYDLLTLRIKVELTEGENDPRLFLTVTVSLSMLKVRQSIHSTDWWVTLLIENKLWSHADDAVFRGWLHCLVLSIYEQIKCSIEEEICTQNCNNCNINEVIMQTQKYVFFFHKWINKLLTEEDKVHRTLFEARKVAGSAIYKQNKTLEFQFV